MLDSHQVKQINAQLLDRYGRFSHTDLPNFRLVWSTAQFEKRWTHHTPEGFELITPEVRTIPKYRQTDPDRWIVERCLDCPENTTLVEPYSYEPLWVFKSDAGTYLEPTYQAIEFIVETVRKAAAQLTGRKYSGPLDNVSPEDRPEAERERINKLKQDLFGNETDISDALGHREGIVVP